ncbi:Alpha/Beta hydrolase protein [Suillus clintonianus]|uniref:Alpha/Beta hydrolase protein n=1 Tax=Suillus clintonianus TaxID=1904413 RepID=UPI001B8782E4|nr:Alpha/Beta hydrolase protein [Suillus clintonianus]KAG2118303.1 Alpha/Beta hydrolase protein [Suillus clintonianus]
MYVSISASQWGSPTAPRKALLIHGLISSSNSWEGVAQLLAAEGFFVVAPNLIGHAWRRGTNYRVSTLVEDLRPYFVKDTSYDVIIGHSLGGTVALSLMPFLPKTKETAVILLDPPLEIVKGTSKLHKGSFLNEVANVRTNKELADNHGLSRRDCVLRALGVSMCHRTVVEGVFLHNKSWSFSGLLKNIPPNVKITMLLADPEVGAVCHLEHIPRGVERLDVKVLPGIGHCIHYECANAIVDAIPLPRAKL